MFKVSLTIDTLDASSPQEAVSMFLNAMQNVEPLFFQVQEDNDAVQTVSSDDIERAAS